MKYEIGKKYWLSLQGPAVLIGYGEGEGKRVYYFRRPGDYTKYFATEDEIRGELDVAYMDRYMQQRKFRLPRNEELESWYNELIAQEVIDSGVTIHRETGSNVSGEVTFCLAKERDEK